MARDLIHESVKTALIEDGWTITDDPFIIELPEDETFFEADLAAEKLIGAQKGMQKIVVEIKTFGGPSILYKFHEALGQYLDYRDALRDASISRELFLAVSVDIFERLREVNFIRRRITQYGLKFLSVDLEEKRIEQWIK